MKAQRLRNLTTGRLHTEMAHIYQDLEFITGMSGLMTHMLPNVMRSIKPWLREKVTDPEYWNDEYEIHHQGDYPIEPMDEDQRKKMLSHYESLPHPLAGKDVVIAVV